MSGDFSQGRQSGLRLDRHGRRCWRLGGSRGQGLWLDGYAAWDGIRRRRATIAGFGYSGRWLGGHGFPRGTLAFALIGVLGLALVFGTDGPRWALHQRGRLARDRRLVASHRAERGNGLDGSARIAEPRAGAQCRAALDALHRTIPPYRSQSERDIVDASSGPYGTARTEIR